MKNQVYTVAELASKLEVTERTISNCIREGKLKGYKHFRKWYITHDQLLEFLATDQAEKQDSGKRSNLTPKQK